MFNQALRPARTPPGPMVLDYPLFQPHGPGYGIVGQSIVNQPVNLRCISRSSWHVSIITKRLSCPLCPCAPAEINLLSRESLHLSAILGGGWRPSGECAPAWPQSAPKPRSAVARPSVSITASPPAEAAIGQSAQLRNTPVSITPGSSVTRYARGKVPIAIPFPYPRK